MKKHLSLTLVLILVLVPILSACTSTTITNTVTNTQSLTLTETQTQTIVEPPTTTKTVTQTVTMQPNTPTPITTTVTSTLTITPTTTTPPITTTIPAGIVFSFTAVGEINTPPFSIDTSPWILRYTANVTAPIWVTIIGAICGGVIDTWVIAGEVYETYIYDCTGDNLYFTIKAAPTDAELTLTVIKIS